MVIVDPRAGSKELIQPLQDRGLDVVDSHLEYGDVSFEGRGVGDVRVSIGLEYKKVGDLLASMRSGRLEGHQLLGMRESPPLYDYAYLLVEGTVHVADGVLVERGWQRGKLVWRPLRGAMSAAEFFKRLHVLQLRGGLTPLWSTDLASSVLQIEMLYRVWTDKPLDEHTSHLAIYNAPPLMPVCQARRTLATLPGLGRQRTAAAHKKFGSIRRAVNATPEEWASLEVADANGKTRKLGNSQAAAIVSAIMEE